MVSNDVVIQAVKRMMASGVDDETVRMTLRGISLSDEEISEVLREVRGTTRKEQAEAEDAAFGAMRGSGAGKDNGSQGDGPDGEGGEDGGADEGEGGDEGVAEGNDAGGEEGDDDFQGEEGSADELHGHIDSASQEQLAHHSETHQMLVEHADRLEAVQGGIGSLHEKVDSMPRLPNEAIAALSALDRRLSSLEKAVAESGAGTSALKSLMQKIIDSERQILLELQKKK